MQVQFLGTRAKSLKVATQAEGLRANFCSNAEGARTLFTKDPPSLAIIDLDIARHDDAGICEAIREMEENEPPVVAVAEQEVEADGIMDWLITPFTDSYARTKIRAWVLRAATSRVSHYSSRTLQEKDSNCFEGLCLEFTN